MEETLLCEAFAWFYLLAVGLMFVAAQLIRANGRSPDRCHSSGRRPPASLARSNRESSSGPPYPDGTSLRPDGRQRT